MVAWGNALGGWRRQKRNARGQFSSSGLHKKARAAGGGFVPYRRHGLGHHTTGFNAGVGSRNRRVSFGVYVRTDTKSGQKKAMKIAKIQEHAQLAVAHKMPNSEFANTDGAKLKLVKKLQGRAIRKVTGGESKSGNAYSRVGTDRNGLPTYIVRYNSPKDRKKGSYNKRNKSVVTYNTNSVTGKRTFDWTQKPYKSRPQRRNAAKKAGVVI